MSGHVHLVLCRGGGSGDRGAVAHRVATVLWLDGLVVEEHRDRILTKTPDGPRHEEFGEQCTRRRIRVQLADARGQ